MNSSRLCGWRQTEPDGQEASIQQCRAVWLQNLMFWLELCAGTGPEPRGHAKRQAESRDKGGGLFVCPKHLRPGASADMQNCASPSLSCAVKSSFDQQRTNRVEDELLRGSVVQFRTCVGSSRS